MSNFVNTSAQNRLPEQSTQTTSLQAALRSVVNTQTILHILKDYNLSSIGVTSQLNSIVAHIIDSVPELSESYAQLKRSETVAASLLSLATFGFKPTPAERFRTEVYKVVERVVEQLREQGLVHVSVVGSIPYIPTGGRSAGGDGPPIIVTTLSLSEAGRRAAEESAKVGS
jgi:hypothetical protein